MNELSTTQKSLLSVGGLGLSIWYAYWRKTRPILPDSLIPDENRKEIIAPQELSSWFYGSWEEQFAKLYMKDVYSYLISKSLKILNLKDKKSLNIIDCGCGTGGLIFEFMEKYSSNMNIHEIYGVDLAPESIKIANNKLKLSEYGDKMKFECKDATILSEFEDNHFDVGYCILVLHDMPHRVPINILCELSRICKYVIVLDWTSPIPWNSAGIRNRRIEFMVGPTHFAGFRQFVALGGIKGHIQALQKYRNGVDVVFNRKIDGKTQELYILDTKNAAKPCKL